MYDGIPRCGLDGIANTTLLIMMSKNTQILLQNTASNGQETYEGAFHRQQLSKQPSKQGIF